MAAGTSVVAAMAAPYLTPLVVKEGAPTETYVETAISTGLTWPLMYFLTGDSETANMYLPVQLGSTAAANLAMGKYKKWRKMDTDNLPGRVTPCGVTTD